MLEAPSTFLAATFSPSMLPRDADVFDVAFERVSLDELRRTLHHEAWSSAVTRPDVAEHLSQALQLPVPVARRRIRLAEGARLFILNPRLRSDLWNDPGRHLDDMQFDCFEVRTSCPQATQSNSEEDFHMLDGSIASMFHLISTSGERLVPTIISSRKRGLRGYHVMPPGKGNDVSSATITTDARTVIEAIVLRGMSVRCKPDGDQRAAPSAISLAQRSAPHYWLHPDLHHWVQGARIAPSNAVGG